MNKKALIIIAAVIIFFSADFLIVRHNAEVTRQEALLATASSTASQNVKPFTVAEVAQHSTDVDCYSTINGKVYDLGSFVYKHPGGDKNILKICGKDGSALFNNQHGGQAKPELILAGFQIGLLVQ